MTALLEVRGLSKRFGGLKAVDGVDLSLAAGEILGVIGPNGAGKTTLFSLIAGSLAPTSGEVLLDGRRVSGLPAHRVVRAGVVRTHQIVRPFPNLTVAENVIVGAIHGARRAGGAPRERAADEDGLPKPSASVISLPDHVRRRLLPAPEQPQETPSEPSAPEPAPAPTPVLQP